MYFVDVQGTLISDSDKSPIRGSIEFLHALDEKDIPYMVVVIWRFIILRRLHTY